MEQREGTYSACIIRPVMVFVTFENTDQRITKLSLKIFPEGNFQSYNVHHHSEEHFNFSRLAISAHY